MKKLLFILLLFCATTAWAEDASNYIDFDDALDSFKKPKSVFLKNGDKCTELRFEEMTVKQLTGISILMSYENACIDGEAKAEIFKRIIEHYGLNVEKESK